MGLIRARDDDFGLWANTSFNAEFSARPIWIDRWPFGSKPAFVRNDSSIFGYVHWAGNFARFLVL